jgi:hypothetical protein
MKRGCGRRRKQREREDRGKCVEENKMGNWLTGTGLEGMTGG